MLAGLAVEFPPPRCLARPVGARVAVVAWEDLRDAGGELGDLLVEALEGGQDEPLVADRLAESGGEAGQLAELLAERPEVVGLPVVEHSEPLPGFGELVQRGGHRGVGHVRSTGTMCRAGTGRAAARRP